MLLSQSSGNYKAKTYIEMVTPWFNTASVTHQQLRTYGEHGGVGFAAAGLQVL